VTEAPVDPTTAPGAEPAAPRRVAPYVVALVALALGGLFWIILSADEDGGSTAETPLLGNPAPAAVGELDDGTEFQLSRRKGSWVVLNFFTHNCVPCIREHPELIAFVDQQRSLGVDGAEFYSVVRDSTQDEVDEFFAARGGDWPVVYDTNFEFVNEFGVALVPETWVIDPNGFVRRRFISEVDADQLSRVLQAMREGAA
jgi:cytochrome c biogenesis protein CcmG/thiol:disulfide interchange protein DsbE